MRTTRGSRWWRWLAVLVVVVVLGVGLTINFTGGDEPRSHVARVAADLADRPAVHYRGVLVDPRDVITTVDMGVTSDGIARGTMTRQFGARAEFAVDEAGTLLTGNREWWFWERPAAADALADQWVVDPPDGATGMPPLAQLTPRALSGQLAAATGAPWTESPDQVAARPGRVLSDGTRHVAVAADAPHRLLAVDLPIHVSPPPAPRSYVSSGEQEPSGFSSFEWRVQFDIEEPTGRDHEDLRRATTILKNTAIGAARPLEDIVVAAPNVDPKLLERLSSRRFQKGRYGIDASPAGEAEGYGQVMLEVLEALTRSEKEIPKDSERLQYGTALQVIDLAVEHHIFAAVHRLVTSGRLMNQHVLAMLTKSIDGAVTAESRNGHIRHVEVAAEYAGMVDVEVRLEVVEDEKNIDVQVTHLTEKKIEDISVKALSGPDSLNKIGDKTSESASQLGNPAQNVTRVALFVVSPEADRLGTMRDRESTGRLLYDKEVHKKSYNQYADPESGLAVDEVRVDILRDAGDGRAQRARYTYTPDEIARFGPPGGSPPARGPGPAPVGGGGGAPAPAPEAAPNPSGVRTESPSLFSKPRSGRTDGALAKVGSPGSPGGIDFSSLELRYLADASSKYETDVRYAFSARQAAVGHEGGAAGPQAAKQASDAFFVWLSLPASSFWVNLNPDEPDRITDDRMGRTDVGRILLEADLELKRSAARLTHPDTPTGARYWREHDRITGGANLCLPLRLWIVPAPAAIYEEDDAVHILDAPLTVRMENTELSAHPRGSTCTPPPHTVLQQYETTVRDVLLPPLQHAVNEGEEYADLRRVYFSRVAAEWYRNRPASEDSAFAGIVGSADIKDWVSSQPWSSREIYDRYLRSFNEGEYTAVRSTPDGSRQEVTWGGIIFGKVPLHKIDSDEFEKLAPGTADTIERAFDHPTPDQSGRVWLGATTQSGFDPFPYLMLAVLGMIIALYLRHRWRRYRRRRAEARTTARATQSVNDRLEALRREATQTRRGG